MLNSNPIGVFDSGIGGITILKEIVTLLPCENIVYIADDNNCPYGVKTTDEIIALSIKNTETLISLGAKIIVVACNTATMSAITILRERFDTPFIAIEPAVKPASSATKSGVVGILATKSSVESDQLKHLCEKYAQDKIIVTQAGVGLVKLVEDNKQDSHEAYQLLESYIQPMIEKNIDHLVLGCTHYPFFLNSLNKIIANTDIVIINPAKSIAQQLKRVMKKEGIINDSKKKGKLTFYSTITNSQCERIEQRYQSYKELEK